MDAPGGMPKSLSALLSQLNRQGITDHRRYHMVRKYMNFRAREQDIPISGCFELTPLCNLDCKMCYVHLNKAQLCNASLLRADVWKQLIKDAVDAGMMYAKITGGECLTYPGFREIYLFLLEKGVETSILTNGILMNQETVSFLVKYPPAAVQISLYGASEEGYEQVTGHRCFSIVLDNILNLKTAGIPLAVALTPNSFMHDGEDILRLAHSLDIPVRINSGLMQPRPETGRQAADADLDSYARLLKLKNTLWGGDVFSGCDEDSLPDPGGQGLQRCGVTCGAGRSAFSISWRGEMRPCNTFPEISCDVLTLGFQESWKQINTQAKQFPLPAECEGCHYQGSCKHCVAEHAAGAPIGHASPTICAWVRKLVSEGIIHL